MLEVTSIDKRWDWNTHKLVVQVGLSDGRTVGIAFPIGHMHIALDESLGELGYYEPCQMGDEFDSIGSLFGRIKKLSKKVGRSVSRSAVGKMYKKTLGRAEHLALQAGRKIARSKAMGGIVGAAAVAFPAVGGPALAAWTVANRAMAIHDQAQRAKALIARGVKHPALIAKVAQGQRVAQTMVAAAQSGSPFGQMVASSLKSMAA
jgi:hypothetical protein